MCWLFNPFWYKPRYTHLDLPMHFAIGLLWTGQCGRSVPCPRLKCSVLNFCHDQSLLHAALFSLHLLRFSLLCNKERGEWQRWCNGSQISLKMETEKKSPSSFLGGQIRSIQVPLKQEMQLCLQRQRKSPDINTVMMGEDMEDDERSQHSEMWWLLSWGSSGGLVSPSQLIHPALIQPLLCLLLPTGFDFAAPCQETWADTSKVRCPYSI